jgi:hypothetical protein
MNRQRLVIFIALIALGAIGYFVARNSYWTEEKVPTPMKGEALRNPFYAAQRFAEALGAHTDWRRVLGTLPASNSVIVLSAWHWDLIDDRNRALKAWVQAGGRLVADRSLIGAEKDLERWAGVTRSYKEKKHKKPGEDDHDEDEDEDNCSLLEVQVHERGGTPQPASYSICNVDLASHLQSKETPTWAVSNDSGMQAMRLPIGRGSFTLVNATPFKNDLLRDGDHARLFAAATQLRRGDSIYFISDDESESLVRIMWRYGAPVIMLFLGLVALALWKGSARFGPLAATPEMARRSLGEQIRGTGSFTLRFGGGQALHGAAVRALFEAARRRIVNFDGLPTDQRLAALARAARLDEGTLSQAVNYSGPRRPGELRNTLALLESARRTILKRDER